MSKIRISAGFMWKKLPLGWWPGSDWQKLFLTHLLGCWLYGF